MFKKIVKSIAAIKTENGRDGEPDLPMSDAFDYKIIN